MDKPDACQAGSDDAQAAAAWSNVAVSALALVCTPVIGSISDVRGRRQLILLGIFVSLVPALVFFVTQHVPTFDPFWYYVASSLTGAINFMTLMFAALSDVVPVEYRAPSYGLMLAGFYGGFAVSPSFPLFLTSQHVGALSFFLILGSLLVAAILLPETLSFEIRQENLQSRESREAPSSALGWRIWVTATRPFREVTILNRDWVIRLVAASSFFSAMVFASDATLVMYYIEDQLDVRAKDISSMFLWMGVVGMALQGGLLQPLVQCLGERGLLIATFCSGILHNFLYGVATNKTTLCVALVLSQLTKLNYPILSALASKGTSVNEQGRVQGALFATNSIAYAVGPLSMEYIYHHTKNKTHFGPGFMFVYAAGLYAIGTVLVALIPIKKGEEPTSQEIHTDDEGGEGSGDLEEPLLEPLLTSDEQDAE